METKNTVGVGQHIPITADASDAVLEHEAYRRTDCSRCSAHGVTRETCSMVRRRRCYNYRRVYEEVARIRDEMRTRKQIDEENTRKHEARKRRSPEYDAFCRTDCGWCMSQSWDGSMCNKKTLKQCEKYQASLTEVLRERAAGKAAERAAEVDKPPFTVENLQPEVPPMESSQPPTPTPTTPVVPPTEYTDHHILQYFEMELPLLEDNLRRFVEHVFTQVTPVGTFERPSGFTKGHHAEDEHGTYGTGLHTRRVVNVARHLLRTFGIDERSYWGQNILTASMLHDSAKYGLDTLHAGSRISKMHPDLVTPATARRFSEYMEEFRWVDIMSIVELHMGRWSPTAVGRKVFIDLLSNGTNGDALSNAALIVHLADVVASRSNIAVNADESGLYE